MCAFLRPLRVCFLRVVPVYLQFLALDDMPRAAHNCQASLALHQVAVRKINRLLGPRRQHGAQTDSASSWVGIWATLHTSPLAGSHQSVAPSYIRCSEAVPKSMPLHSESKPQTDSCLAMQGWRA